MAITFAILTGILYWAGVHLLMSRNAVRLVVGVVLVSHGTNLLIFTSGGLTRAEPPLIPPDAETLAGPYANPLSQALILTAIVISLAIQIFFLVLAHRAVQATEQVDTHAMRSTEP